MFVLFIFFPNFSEAEITLLAKSLIVKVSVY